MIDIEELKKLAAAAGSGQWLATLSNGAITRAAVCHGDGDVLCECFSNIGHQPEPVFEDDIAQYIAAANPQTVLALIAENAAMRQDLERKSSSLAIVSNALSYAESQVSEWRCKSGTLENELRRAELDKAELRKELEEARKDAEMPNTQVKMRTPPNSGAIKGEKIKERMMQICGCKGQHDCDCVSVENRARSELWYEHNTAARQQKG